MVNIWNQYQCMVTFNMSRSAPAITRAASAAAWASGIPARTCWASCIMIPDTCPGTYPGHRRHSVSRTAAAYHQYQPLTKKGNRDVGCGFNDDPLWLIAGTAAYLRETGDWSILDESVAFDNDEEQGAAR